MSSALEHWIWLGLAFGHGNGRTDEIIRRFGDPLSLYRAVGGRTLPPGLTQAEWDRLRGTSLDEAKRVAERMHRRGVAVLTPEDGEYPHPLRELTGMPCVLYVEGTLACLQNRLAIAMVGTRRCSVYGERAARKVATELAEAGVVLVSGMAAGIDTACHWAALDAGAPTVAVMGSGIDKTYPAQNTALREQISQNGAVVTEFPPDMPSYPGNFPLRNRIIAALSSGLVVVEAGERSGSLITVNLALELGRDVFVVPGEIFSPGFRGSFRLLREGAIPVSGGLDVLEEYPEHLPARERPAQRPEETESHRMESLTEEARAVYHAIEKEALDPEEIARRLQKPMRQVLTALTELEIMGMALALPGRRYQCRTNE